MGQEYRETSCWAGRGHRAATAALIVCAAVVCLGWMTDARDAMSAIVYALGAVAFLPFLIILVAVAFTLLLGAIVGLTAEAGADGAVDVGLEGVEAGASFVGPYYRFLSRRRHPLWLGSAVGLLLGALLLGLGVIAFIGPREAETALILTRAQAALTTFHHTEGHLPGPEQGGLPGHSLGWAQHGVVRDAFGLELQYDLERSVGRESYELRSLGYDGVRSDDDLCVAGTVSGARTLLRRVARIATSISERLTGDAPPWEDRIAAVRELRCGP